MLYPLQELKVAGYIVSYRCRAHSRTVRRSIQATLFTRSGAGAGEEAGAGAGAHLLFQVSPDDLVPPELRKFRKEESKPEKVKREKNPRRQEGKARSKSQKEARSKSQKVSCQTGI